MTQSGRTLGQEHVETLKKQLAKIETLPIRGGKINATALTKLCGVDRQVLYKNPQCRALIEERLNQEDLPGLTDKPRPNLNTQTRTWEDLNDAPTLKLPFNVMKFGYKYEILSINPKAAQNAIIHEFMHLMGGGHPGEYDAS